MVQPVQIESEDRDEKERAIIQAARTVFLSNGFDGASMDTIALKANVSKRTVYNRFKSKEALFGASIEETCRRILPVDVEAAVASTTSRALVKNLSRAFLQAIFHEEAIALRRIATFEASRKPELGRTYLENGLYYMVSAASAIVVRMQSQGIVREAPADRVVYHLGALITEPLYSELLLGVEIEDQSKALEDQLEMGLDAFWRLYGTDLDSNK
ncbi:MAG: TetR/AcrR family transcriptional regulator [Pseudomonadota bacterium]